jgi:hypothetical protein
MRISGKAIVALAGASTVRAADTLSGPALAGTLSHTGILRGEKPLSPRVLFVTAKDSLHSAEELARLSQPGGDFEKMRAAGWTIGDGANNLIQIIDHQLVPEIVERLGVTEFPTVACIDKDEIVRYFRWGCTTPLDMYTFGFLAKGIDERPPGFVMEKARVESTGHYPLRGNHWSVDGDWSPSKDKVVSHLRGPVHQAFLQTSWKLEEWSVEELRSVHDDLHERYGPPSDSGGSSRDSSSRGPAGTQSGYGKH